MADGKVIIDIDGSTSGFESALGSIGGIASKAVTGITVALAGIGTAAAAASKEAVNIGMDYTAAMSEVQAISGATAEEYALLSEKAREMGATTMFSASDAAAALKYMAMAGWQTEDMLSGINGIMNLAAASGEDLGTVSDIVTDALTAFGMSAKDSGRFADVLAAASSAANTNVSMLGESFKYIAPLAGAMGYSIEDTAVALGLMANSGIKSGQAGTTLRAALTRLVKPTEAASYAMEDLGLYADGVSTSIVDADGNVRNFADTMEILRDAFAGLDESQKTYYATEIFGQEAMSGMLAIINASAEDYEKLTDRINSASGAAETMAEVMTDNLSGDVAELKSAWEEAQLTFFDDMENPLRNAVQWLTDGVKDVTAAYKEGGFGGLKEAFIEEAKELPGELGKLFFGDDSTEGGFSLSAERIGRAIGTAVSKASDYISAETISSVGTALWDGLTDAVSAAVEANGGLGGILSKAFSTAGEITIGLKDIATRIVDDLAADLAETDWTSVGNVIGGGIAGALSQETILEKTGDWFLGHEFDLWVSKLKENLKAGFDGFAEGVLTDDFVARMDQILTKLGFIGGDTDLLGNKLAEFSPAEPVSAMDLSAPMEAMQGISEESAALAEKLGYVTEEAKKLGEEAALTAKASAKAGIAAAEGVIEQANAINETLSGIEESLSEEKAAELGEKAAAAGTAIGDGLSSGVSEGAGNAVTEIEGIPAAAEKAMSSDKGYQIGLAFAQGLKNGIEDGKEEAISAASDVAAGLVSTAKLELRVRSPSRVARDEIGLMFSRGLALGIADGMPEVRAMTEGKLSEMIARAKAVVEAETARLPGVGGSFFGNMFPSWNRWASDDGELMRELRGLREDYRRGSVVTMDRQVVGRLVSKQQSSDARVYGK